jgi:hypothetical protein
MTSHGLKQKDTSIYTVRVHVHRWYILLYRLTKFQFFSANLTNLKRASCEICQMKTSFSFDYSLSSRIMRDKVILFCLYLFKGLSSEIDSAEVVSIDRHLIKRKRRQDFFSQLISTVPLLCERFPGNFIQDLGYAELIAIY